MQEQYNKIKEKYKDYILLFRLGDFYEAFHNDAEVLSRILGITLTGRGKNEDRIPMAGIPCHALNNYIPRILEHKLKIAIADQLEEPKPGKLVNREVTRIITPGTITDDKLIEDSKNNFIASILVENVSKQDKYHFSLAYSDITTGEVYEFVGDNLISLQKEILKVNPSEIIIEKSCYLMISNILENFFINQLDDEYVTLEEALQIIKSTFSVYDIRSLGLTEGNYLSIKSLATLLKYFNDVQKKNLEYIKFLKRYDYHKTMQLDYQTIKNLEIFDSQNKQISLYDVINKCQNPMGKRLLRKRIQRPFKDSEI
ncbi:MAG: hypothetical protein NZZ41_07040, partial [Candidatus Dojkabacteria bacterium]|nr:hypothetical protein [Candidatus Dojkabacteria bacterium]